MREFRVGLIGCGGIANAHATRLRDLGRTRIVALCDVDPSRTAEFNQKYAGGRAALYSEFSRMLTREKLDAVWICLPPFAHSHEVELAASRGIHVFIEKPIALDRATAARMVRAVEKHRVKSQVGFMMRFGDAVERVRTMMALQEAGQAGWAVGTYRCNALHAPWWREKSKSGGQIVEQIIHTYDIIRYLLGEPASVFCFADNLFHKKVERYTSEDVSAALIRFRNGAVASIAGTNGAIPGRWQTSFSLVCRNITVDFSDANHATIYHTDRQPVPTTIVSSDKDMMLAEILDLLGAIENKGKTRTPMSEGAATLDLVLGVRESAETGRVVTLLSSKNKK